MNTHTPLTDAKEWKSDQDCQGQTRMLVGADFAREMEIENAMLRELLGDVLSHSVDAGMYPDGPCLEKWLRTDIKEALAKTARS